jgi:hypothetical protein
MITQLPLLASLTIVTAGTPLQFVNSTQTAIPGAPGVGVVEWRFNRIELRVLAANTGNILVGFKQRGTLVKPIVLAPTALPLILKASSEHVPINLNDLWFDATVSGSVVMLIGTPSRK